MKYIITYFLLISIAQANNYLDENVKKLDWKGIDVVWLEDNALPTYDVSLYFNAGALGDGQNHAGLTELMFSELSSGTHRYTKKEIIESLEYLGVSYGSHVTHEYSTFSVGGLVKNMVPTMKMVCHLFDDATFPAKELKHTKRRVLTAMDSMVTNHSKLASRAFRYESLKNTGFESPTLGYKKSLKKMTSNKLQKRLKYLNSKAIKRIYIRGPKEVMGLKNIILNDCRWRQGQVASKLPIVKKPRVEKSIIFVPVPGANQAQVRIGRVITTDEVQMGKDALKTFSANFLGGGFTSRLFQKLRVEKGLTYSASAYSSEQKNYGRSGVSTFTRNEKIVELLESIKKVLVDAATKIGTESFTLSKKNLKGNYLLGLESTSDFLQNLIHFDHIEKDYSEIYQFTKKMDAIEIKNLQAMIAQLFDWKKQVILILGDKKLVKVLRKAGYKVKISNYKKYI
ncbi:MAG: insulinase family protein [Halobacteriovoraceae bacterium]|jgi:zinc protease|nr:insulinase family protein [Halobacteriovoraceae bacterium]